MMEIEAFGTSENGLICAWFVTKFIGVELTMSYPNNDDIEDYTIHLTPEHARALGEFLLKISQEGE